MIAPAPFDLQAVQVTSDTDGTPFVLVMFNGVHGVAHYFLPMDMAKTLGKALYEMSTGIVMPEAAPIPPLNLTQARGPRPGAYRPPIEGQN